MDAIPKAIRGVVQKLANAVPDKVKELLGRLKDAIYRKIKDLWGGLWGRKEWTAAGEKHKAWVDYKRGKVRVSSREEDASELLKELKHRADDSKNEKVQKLVAEAQDVLKNTQESIATAPAATQKGGQKGQKGAKKKGPEAKAVKEATKKVEAGLDKLAGLLKEIQEALGGGTCKTRKKKEAAGAGCWREGVAERDQDGQGRAIQKWRAGRRIPTLLQTERADAAPPRLEINPALWREVFLVQDDADNDGVLTMALLRPLDWLEQHGVELGAWVAIDLPEMGVQGKALVTAVQPCPEIEEGEGSLVTGTFRRSKAFVIELKVSGEPEVCWA